LERALQPGATMNRPTTLLLLALFTACGQPLASGIMSSDPSTDGDASTSDPKSTVDDASAYLPWSSDDAGPIDTPFDSGLVLGADADAPDVPPSPPFDAGPGGICTSPLGPGDLAITELMVESVAGTGDHGEWLEVTSRRDCALDLVGLHGECATGAKVNTFDVTDDLWIPARGTFVVADSSNPAVSHDLPGTILTWLGEPGDVLRNKGDTVTLLSNGAIVDTVTYPATAAVVGVTMAFPSDCPDTARTSFASWQQSSASWFPGFSGTPNAPNTDVHCP
jgi:hypothetical protein